MAIQVILHVPGLSQVYQICYVSLHSGAVDMVVSIIVTY